MRVRDPCSGATPVGVTRRHQSLGSHVRAPSPPGSRLGPYLIAASLGAGGMGEVFKAHDPRLNRTVAIKVLTDDLSSQPEARARFEREARAIAGLNHPHIATLHDIGRHEHTDFLVMELLEGETLAEHLARGPLALARALTYAIEIAAALDQAHRHGVIHRDLKPGNVMITRSGVKLLDFGLAKLRPSSIAGVTVVGKAADVTAEGAILGTVQYMAPEQLEGGEADARTDIFAFGTILHEMVTGKRAFEGSTHASVIGNILHADPPSLASIEVTSPPTLDLLVRKCLAKDPAERWKTATDVQARLEALQDITRHFSPRHPPMPNGLPTTSPSSDGQSRSGPTDSRRM